MTMCDQTMKTWRQRQRRRESFVAIHMRMCGKNIIICGKNIKTRRQLQRHHVAQSSCLFHSLSHVNNISLPCASYTWRCVIKRLKHIAKFIYIHIQIIGLFCRRLKHIPKFSAVDNIALPYATYTIWCAIKTLKHDTNCSAVMLHSIFAFSLSHSCKQYVICAYALL